MQQDKPVSNGSLDAQSTCNYKAILINLHLAISHFINKLFAIFMATKKTQQV